MSGWRETTIAELASPAANALSTGPFGSAISAKHFVDEGIPVLRGSNLSLEVGIRLNDRGLAFLPPEKAAEFTRSVARRGDLVFTCWGTIGQVGLVDDRAKYTEYVVSNKQMKLTPDPLKADSHFLYYLLSSPEMIQAVKGQAIGAAVPGFNLGQLRELRLRLPPLAMQRVIATVLTSIDEIIENNRRQVHLLEEMALATYREWFVHFRYPGYEDATLVDSPFGPIPGGWTAGRVEDLFTLQRGFDLPSATRAIGNVPIVGASGIQGFHDVPKVRGPGVATGRSGTIGVVTYVPTDFWPLNTALWVKDFRTVTPLYAYLFLQTLNLLQTATGAAVPTLNRNHVHALPALAPPPNIVQRWNALVEPLFATAASLQRQSEGLVALRDLLLPNLVSGRVDVSSLDHDALVEYAVA